MARVRDFDRTRTLQCASGLFATQGYDRTSVDRIIKQAGVSKGAFYHFSSNEEILDAVTADVSVGATVRFDRFLNASRVWRLAHFGLLI